MRPYQAAQEATYRVALERAIADAAPMMARVGCRLEVDGAHVALVSPRTGRHTLHMALGVRPVADLAAHVEGFVEAQAGPRAPVYWMARATTPSDRAVRKAGRKRLLRDFARAARLVRYAQWLGHTPGMLLHTAAGQTSRSRYACLMTAFGM